MRNEIRMMPAGYLIGADPELFVFRGDEPVSAHDLIPGTKAAPHPVPGGAIQVDGTAAEFNIDPAETFEEFNDNIERVLAALTAYLPEDCVLRNSTTVTWEYEYFERLPHLAKELGCMPDFNAWTGRPNKKPALKEMPTLRTAAGHIHIGFTNGASLQDVDHIKKARLLTQMMDWHVGAWACSVDTDRTRRQLYGKAGACRYKSYGVEYRTLSNFWVLDEALRLEVWNRTAQACHEFDEKVANGSYNSIGQEYFGEEQTQNLIQYINEG